MSMVCDRWSCKICVVGNSLLVAGGAEPLKHLLYYDLKQTF